MPTPRGALSALFVNGTLYATGGHVRNLNINELTIQFRILGLLKHRCLPGGIIVRLRRLTTKYL